MADWGDWASRGILKGLKEDVEEEERLEQAQKKIMNIYVASSWKNAHQIDVVNELRKNGFDAYDFRDPKGDFEWKTIWEKFDAQWQNSPVDLFKKMLQDPIAEKGFFMDWTAMHKADVCVMVLPCGRSAHLECGYFIGSNKPTVIYIPTDEFQVELMYRSASLITNKIDQVISYLKSFTSFKSGQ